jgi:hypothetical protein
MKIFMCLKCTEAYRFENQAKAFDKEAMTSHTFWEKDYTKKVRDFFSKNMIGGNTRDESSIRLQKQAHVKRESHELEEEDGAYVSKPGTNACMTSNHKSLHICFFRYRRRP